MAARCQCGATGPSYPKLQHNPGCPVEELRARIRRDKEDPRAQREAREALRRRVLRGVRRR